MLLSGAFDLMKRYPDGERRIAVRDQPGEWLGELPIVFGAPFFAGARATTALRVARFDRPQFGQLVRESDAFKQRLHRRDPGARGGPRDPGGRRAAPPDRGRPRERSRLPRPARLPLAQPGALRVGRPGRRSGRPRGPICRRRSPPPQIAPSCSCPTAASCRTPRSRELAVGVGLQVEPRERHATTSWSSAAARRASRLPCTARRRACTRCSSRARRPADRPAPRRASRTTSASRAASRATTSRRARAEQAQRLGAEIVVTRRIEAIAPTRRLPHRDARRRSLRWARAQ